MPYLKKDELKEVIVSAFNEGLLAGVAIDHDEGSVEQFLGSIDVDDFYENNYMIQSKLNKTK